MLGQNVTAIPSGNYDVELYYRVPLAFDLVKLLGEVYAEITLGPQCIPQFRAIATLVDLSLVVVGAKCADQVLAYFAGSP